MNTGAAPFYRVVQDYTALIEVMRERCEHMELARLELDRIAGFATGYSGKLLSRAPTRVFGKTSLGATLQSLGLIMVIVADPVATALTLARRTPSVAYNQRFRNNNNSKKSPPPIERQTTGAAPAPAAAPETPRKSQPASRAHLHVVESRLKGRARWGSV